MIANQIIRQGHSAPAAARIVAPREQGDAQNLGPLAIARDALADKLNKTELAYRDLLDFRKRSGEIRDYRTHAITFILGKDMRYTPDFNIVESDGTMTMVEVKGFLRDDALVKFRAAQRQMPWFRWIMVQRCAGGWKTIRE